jgi:hypothetical protein
MLEGRDDHGGSEGAALGCNTDCGIEADWPLAVANC